jgi:photosystem II stability/assembly factor-like uncharacterized protein
MTRRSRPSVSFRTRATDRISIAVGTTKGLFFLREGGTSEPAFKGRQVMSLVELDDRLLAAVTDPRFGAMVHTSLDRGESWDEPTKQTIAFPKKLKASVSQVWQLHRQERPDGTTRVLAGVEPAALFSSEDHGQSFELFESLWKHPHREHWEPGGGGLCLHTIVTHPELPDRIMVGISTGGVYRSDDGGKTWTVRNKGISARHLPEGAEFGQCVHKIAVDAAGPEVLWLQNHWGIYRSENGGDNWEDVGAPGTDRGVPSDFGFPIVAHPAEPGTAYVFPLESDMYRCSPAGACRVFRTSDAGKSWEPLTSGLPMVNAHLSVLRDAFTVSHEPPYALVFGTRTGQVFASADSGENWRLLAEHLPPVLSVRVIE